MKAIVVDNISKKYNIIRQGKNYLSLRDKIGQIFQGHNFLFGKNSKNEFKALKNVSFGVETGDILGIIGDNGSGKSTLLKIISGVTHPSNGQVEIRGRVTSMLEVGTGFHPELSGRENIFLNGAILGMSRKEINKHFEEIVEFSGVKDFLDTPVKHYSTGMYTRLAFSVAVNMDSDILLIDEVLAVGDIEFQKKCLMKMGEVSKNGKKTILFVSHNLHAVQGLCNKCVLLEKGKIAMKGKTHEVVQKYIKRKNNGHSIDLSNRHFDSKDFELQSFKLDNSINNSFCVYTNSPIIIKIRLLAKTDINFLTFVVGIETLDGSMIYNSWDADYIKEKFSFEKNKVYDVVLQMKHNLSVGTYNIAFTVLGGDRIYENFNQAILDVVSGEEKYYPKRNNGAVNFDASWSKQEL